MWSAVWPAEAIADEIQVVTTLTEITAIGPVGNAIGCFPKTVVEPFPDKAPLQSLVGFNSIPVFLQIAAAVAHGVGILTHD